MVPDALNPTSPAEVVTPAREQRRWWRRIDPLVYVLGTAALIVFVLHGFDGSLHQDLAIYSYGGQQVVEGVPPYVSILNRAGPLAHFLPALGVGIARVGGLDDLFGIRLLFMLLSVACVCVIYVLARDLLTSRISGVVTASAFLSFYGFIQYATYGPREKTPMVLLLLCSLLTITKRWWFAAGISVSLATLVWQPALLVGLAAALTAWIAVRSSERVPALVRFGIGSLIPAGICVLYFTLVGALQEFIDAFVLINARYTTAAPFVQHFAGNWASLQRGYGITLWVMVIGLIALPILILVKAPRSGWRRAVRDPIAPVAAASLGALAWTLRDFNAWPDAFVLLPMAAIGFGGLVKELERLLDRVAVTLAFAVTIAALAMALNYSITKRDDELGQQRASVAGLLGQLPPDPSIVSIGAPEPLVLMRATNPTRHQTFKRGLDRYVDDTWPGGLPGYAEWVQLERPTIVSVAGERVPWWLRETLTTGYRRAGRAPGWYWWVTRSVGPDIRVPSDS